MLYNSYHFLGLHLKWWIGWLTIIFWIFAVPFYLLALRKKKYAALNLLHKRFASGQITNYEYLAMKRIIQND